MAASPESVDTPLPFAALTIGREIGRGAFSRVFVGSYDGHDVAIKKVTLQAKDAEKYLMQELGLLKAMVHPNLIHYFGAAFNRPDIYIVTEFMNGGSEFQLLPLTKENCGSHPPYSTSSDGRPQRSSTARSDATPMAVALPHRSRCLLGDRLPAQR